ncbi:MAG: sulfite exporter TauE/SafE family protein [Desulfovibrio sp.]|nr:sulfite exporter TauE/SafE family protein [Desulfovibrio sp.]
MVTSLIIFLIIGCFVGVLAGLLGVGGGTVIVPIIIYSFNMKGISGDFVHYMALGTSLATIMCTSISSLLGHHRKKAVLWDVVKQITPCILLGTFFGSKIAVYMPIVPLKLFFIFFLIYAGTSMFLNVKPKPSRSIPGFAGNSAAGGIIGIVSSFVGIGGGSLSVPYLTWCNVPTHQAIGTSAAIGFPIALAGALGYVVSGQGVEGLPGPHLGYIYLPAFFGIAIASVCTAPVGVRLSHSLPVPKLKRAFAVLLFTMAAQMLYKTFF